MRVPGRGGRYRSETPARLAALAAGIIVFCPIRDLTGSAPRLTAQTMKDAAPVSKEFTSARKELSALDSGKAFVARLETLAGSLPPSEALSLLSEFSGRALQTNRQTLWIRAASMALLLGRFDEAGQHFETAAGAGNATKDLDLLLRAARCRIAAGDTARARSIVSDIRLRSESASKASIQVSPSSSTPSKSPPGSDPGVHSVIEAEILEAWSWLVEGDSQRAARTVRVLLSEPGRLAIKGSSERRESLFILWNSGSAKERSDAASSLGSEYPGSPEAEIVGARVKTPPLAHWFLGVMHPRDIVSDTSGIAAMRPPGDDSPSSREASVSDRLQVGYFSREENARQLRQELVSKGFSAIVESHTTSGGLARWIVTVGVRSSGGSGNGSGKPPAIPVTPDEVRATQLRLKDLGYESYPVE